MSSFLLIQFFKIDSYFHLPDRKEFGHNPINNDNKSPQNNLGHIKWGGDFI